MKTKTRIDWRRVWREFDEWRYDASAELGWNSLRRKIRQLVDAQLAALMAAEPHHPPVVAMYLAQSPSDLAETKWKWTLTVLPSEYTTAKVMTVKMAGRPAKRKAARR